MQAELKRFANRILSEFAATDVSIYSGTDIDHLTKILGGELPSFMIEWYLAYPQPTVVQDAAGSHMVMRFAIDATIFLIVVHSTADGISEVDERYILNYTKQLQTALLEGRHT